MRLLLASTLCLLGFSVFADNQDPKKSEPAYKFSNETIFNKTLLPSNGESKAELCSLTHGIKSTKEVHCYVERGSAAQPSEEISIPRLSDLELLIKTDIYHPEKVAFISKTQDRFKIHCIGQKYGEWPAKQGHQFDFNSEFDMIKSCIRSSGLYIEKPTIKQQEDVAEKVTAEVITGQ